MTDACHAPALVRVLVSDADGRMSSEALRRIVAPVLRAARVGEELCHPHVLRHTFATLYVQRPDARLERLQLLMRHASIDTTAQCLHTTTTTTTDELEADAAARETRRTDAGDGAGRAARRSR